MSRTVNQPILAAIITLAGLAGLAGCATASDTNSANLNAGSKAAPVSEHLASPAGSSHTLYELRTYTTNAGKLDALHARFRDHTQRLFEKHGMVNVAYWTPVDTPNTLVYIVAHKSRDAAKAAWAAFVADPEWRAVYANSIAQGRLVANIDSVFMEKTDYSPK